jgi:hypothetical protein
MILRPGQNSIIGQRGILPVFGRVQSLPPLIPWESDFSPNDANQIAGDVGGNLANTVGVAQTLDLTAAAKTLAGGMISATGNLGRGVGLAIYGSVATAPTAAEGALLVGWGADSVAPQNSLFLSVGSATGANEWALYKQIDGVNDVVGAYAATPADGDLFVITHSKQGAISISINGTVRITGNFSGYARNGVWGLTWTANESVGAFGTHSGKANKFVVEEF